MPKIAATLRHFVFADTKTLSILFIRFNPASKKHLLRQVLFATISVPCGTGNISRGYDICLAQRQYVIEKERQLVYNRKKCICLVR